MTDLTAGVLKLLPELWPQEAEHRRDLEWAGLRPSGGGGRGGARSIPQRRVIFHLGDAKAFGKKAAGEFSFRRGGGAAAVFGEFRCGAIERGGGGAVGAGGEAQLGKRVPVQPFWG